MILRNITLGILALVAGISALRAQDNFRCGQVEMTEKYWAEHPEYREIALKQEEALKNLDLQAAMRDLTKDGEHLIVPVVFHVVHNNGPENISDEQLKSALVDLNKRYRIENDTSQVVSAFKSIVSDIQIEFRLATKTPNGQCTSGINRYEDARTNEATDNVKEGRQWDASRYLNIYVARGVGQGVAGYSRLPGQTSPEIDGINMRADYTGTIGTSSPGRASTLAHEVGHYMGLYHLWGSNNNPGQPSGCDGDDEVEDTPLTIGNSWCNLNAVSCGSLDNVQNYMEYAGCRHMFTKGQKARIYGFIAQNASGRQTLTSPQNAITTGANYARDSFPNNLCQVAFDIELDGDQVCPGEPIQFKDQSLFDIVSWSWSFPGGQPESSNEKNPIVVYSQGGFYNVSLTVSNSSGETETLTKEEFVFVDASGNLSYPVEENFYSPEMFDPSPVGWFKVNNPDEDVYWQLIEPTGYDDDRCIALETYSVSTFNNLDEFVSGVINLPSEGNPKMSFYYAHTFKNSPQNSDELRISISTDCGGSWSQIAAISDEEIQTASARNNFFKPANQGEWKKFELDLSQYAGSSVRFTFSYTHKGGNNIYIDKFQINSTTGIFESETRNSFARLYPNPSKSNTKVWINSSKKIENIRLTDATGRLISEQTPIQENANIAIQLPRLEIGLYYIYCEAEGAKQVLPLLITE